MRALARAARRSCELREEGGVDRAQPDLHVRRRLAADRSPVAPGARGAAALRAGAEDDAELDVPFVAPGAVALRRRPAALRSQRREPGRLLDLLLCGALIEARSCERFVGLAPRLRAPLGDFYGGLRSSEARHQGLYLRLAEQRAGAMRLAQRVCSELAEIEAELATSPDPQFRFHSGEPLSSSKDALVSAEVGVSPTTQLDSRAHSIAARCLARTNRRARCASSAAIDAAARGSPGDAYGRESMQSTSKRAKRRATTSSWFTSMMCGRALSIDSMCALLPARMRSASPCRCCSVNRRSIELHERIAHDAAQALVGMIVGAQRVAVHEQYALAVQVDHGAVGEQRRAGLAAEALADQEVAVAVHDEAVCTPASRQRAQCLRSRGACLGSGRRRRSRLRTDRRGCTALVRVPRFAARKSRNCA